MGCGLSENSKPAALHLARISTAPLHQPSQGRKLEFLVKYFILDSFPVSYQPLLKAPSFFFFLIVQLSDGKLQKVLPQIVNVCKYCWSHMLLNSKTKWLYMISVKFGPMVQKLCQVYCIIFLLLRRVAIRYIFHLFIPLNTGITNWKYQMSKVTLHLVFNQNQSKMCIFFSF